MLMDPYEFAADPSMLPNMYVHGCVEQTTSGVFPQLYLDKVVSLNEKSLAEVRSNVNAGIDRLLGMQIAFLGDGT